MTGEQVADVRAIVVETLAEQQRIRHDDIDAVVLKAVATTLTSFGIDEEDRKELRSDFQHLRRWRRSVEQAQSYTFKAVITVIVTGFVGAVWLGISDARQMICGRAAILPMSSNSGAAMYRIREVDGTEDDIADFLAELHQLTFLDAAPRSQI